MRIKLKDKPKVDVREWHEHFKIFPKVINGHLVFFEKVQRRLAYHWGEYYWQYRLIERKEANESKT